MMGRQHDELPKPTDMRKAAERYGNRHFPCAALKSEQWFNTDIRDVAVISFACGVRAERARRKREGC